jgi:hypothetical protein
MVWLSTILDQAACIALATNRVRNHNQQVHGLMPRPSDGEQHKDPNGKKPAHKVPLLARMAQFMGLALLVFALAAAIDLLRETPTTFEEFRSGMGYAYLAALSVLIAISSVSKTLAEDLRNAGFLAAAGIFVMVTFTGDSSPFELLSAIAGVFYVVVVRRMQPS